MKPSATSRVFRMLVIVAVLQGTLMVVLYGGTSVKADARQQVPAAFNQNERTVDELRSLNQKMDRLIELIESGKLQVQAVAPADTAGGEADAKDEPRLVR